MGHSRRPEFLTSLKPLEEDPADSPIVASMIRAGKKAGTGPMAAVAGAVAEFVGKELLQWSPGSDHREWGRHISEGGSAYRCGNFCGNSRFSGRLGIQVQATVLPIGICTSSGRVGPSLSLGVSDAATIISKDAALADAVATAMGNRIRSHQDLKAAVEWAVTIPGWREHWQSVTIKWLSWATLANRVPACSEPDSTGPICAGLPTVGPRACPDCDPFLPGR